MIEREDLSAWLRLLETPGLGRGSARKLLAAFGSPQAVIDAPAAARCAVTGHAEDLLAREPDDLKALIKNTSDWLEEGAGPARDVIVLGDPRYSSALLQTADPPLMLYAMGRVELLQSQASLAVVGSRNPTAQGIENARAFSAELSRAGMTIVSGLALGIDGAAHEGGLAGAGSTIAVVGTGLDRVYPKRHHELARRIAAEGLMLSEFALGTPPLAPNFPLRNRIIAGLSRGTLVAEAAVQSGSLITARMALEAGREVFAIPGSIHSPQSRGCHALIKQGAKLVETASDILEELAPSNASDAGEDHAFTPHEDDALEQDPLLEALGHDPVTLDALIARTGLPAQVLSARLLELEFDAQVVRLPGQLFQRLHRV